jgi:feruloyl esterase
MKWLEAGLAAAGLSLIGGLAHAESADCTKLASLSLPHATVTAAAEAPAGPGMACKVDVTSKPTADSDIRIEVWLPEGAAWNGRYVQLGNGGFAGRINPRVLQALASQGYAVAMTDDGHEAEGTDGRWAIGHPEKVIDFGWRALKETTKTAKALVRAFEGAGPKYAYFQGCSDGGREALMEAQRFPDDFDGIIAGAPAYNFSGLLALAAHDVQSLSRPGSMLDNDALKSLETGALTACGGGAYVRDQAGCQFDPASLACAPGHAPPGCLTPAQVAAAVQIERGIVGRGGAVVYPGHSPGAEAEPGAWATWITGGGDLPQSLSFKFAIGFWGGFVYGEAAYDVTKLDIPGAPKAAAAVAKEVNSTDPDLAKFRAHGGKLIQYHGWDDPAIPSRGSIVYYEEVGRTLGDTADFYRLYMIPGMLHCGGGPGPGAVDWLGTLRAWVEDHKAPEGLTAALAAPGQPPAPGAPTQRLCPWPRKPQDGDRCA